MKIARRALAPLAVLLPLSLMAVSCSDDNNSSTTTAPGATDAADTTGPADSAADTTAPTATAAETTAPMETYDMNVAVSPAVTVLPQYIAMAEGFFEAHGINATFVGVQNGPDLGAAMISGDITVAGNIPNNQIGLINAGFDVVAVNEIVQAQFFDILVSSNVDLGGATEWQDVMAKLEGTNVGVVANGAAAEDIARTLFQEAGVDPDKQTYIATGLPDTTIAAMQNGQIDVAITFDPAFVIAESQGIGTQPFSLRAGDGPASLLWPSLLGTMSREYVTANPGAAAAYKAAIADAVQFIQDPANREEVLRVMADDMQMSADLAPQLLDANIDYFNPTGDFHTAELDAAGQWVHDIGKSDAVLTAADFTVS